MEKKISKDFDGHIFQKNNLNGLGQALGKIVEELEYFLQNQTFVILLLDQVVIEEKLYYALVVFFFLEKYTSSPIHHLIDYSSKEEFRVKVLNSYIEYKIKPVLLFKLNSQ